MFGGVQAWSGLDRDQGWLELIRGVQASAGEFKAD